MLSKPNGCLSFRIGAGGGEGAMDAANILKPALARGELRAVGATTLSEYQKYFEKDKALERRFQQRDNNCFGSLF